MNNYQNIVVNNTEYGVFKRKNSKYFNENKWDTFIDPLLPVDCKGLTLIDFGCNYGIFLNLASQKGFKNVIGIESNNDVVEIAKQYTNANIINFNINETIYQNNFLFNLEASDYILLSNFHYHVHISALIYLLSIIKRKTRYAIVVSAHDARSKLYNAKPNLDSVRRYFKDWKEINIIDPKPIKDPAPRKMFSVLFKTNIERIPIKDIKFGKYGKRFYTKVRKDIIKQLTPMTHPILLRPDGSLIDGNHRLATVELNGEDTILCETI